MEISSIRMSDSSAFGDRGGLFSGSRVGGGTGMLDLEMSIPMYRQSQIDQTFEPSRMQSMNLLRGLENERPTMFTEGKDQDRRDTQVSLGKGIGVDVGNITSEEDDSQFVEADGNGHYFNKGSFEGSPWQRMKWTDHVVRLLVVVVAYVGDDGLYEFMGGGIKRRTSMSQRKGKWKTISKIMISKGCHVSPQQCEDKFNDLNKRYKKLNEILGGATGRVVENPALMDSMPHLSTNMKEGVKKILSSKHLFYDEMCAYHNGQLASYFPHFDLPQPRSCAPGQCSTDDNGSEDMGNAKDSDDSLFEDGKNSNECDVRRMEERQEREAVEAEGRTFWPVSDQSGHAMELSAFYQDPFKPVAEKRVHVKRQMLQLEEQRISLKVRSLEIEREHFKWLKFRCKKDRELGNLRIENERMKLENERMILQLRQKELELDMKRSGSSKEDPKSVGSGRS